MGLEFLMKHGSDCVGVIDTEEKLAGALVWENLRKRGFVFSLRGPSGPTYYLTEAGRRAICSNPPPMESE